MKNFLKLNQKFKQESVNNFLRIKKNSNQVSRAFLRNFKEFLLENDRFDDERKYDISKVKIKKKRGDTSEKRHKIVISKEDVWKMHDECKTEFTKLLILTSYYCALRASELIKIKGENFNFKEWKQNPSENGTLIVLGKGNKIREIIVPSFLMIKLRIFLLEKKNNHFKDIEMKEFLDYKIFPITYWRWRDMLRNISSKTLGKRIGTHVMRRSFATNLLEGGFDITEVQKHLGHSSIATTQEYIILSKKHLSDKLKKFTQFDSIQTE